MNKDQEWLLKEKYNGDKSAAFFADCERLASGEPLAYVIGAIPFLDCTIHLNSKPLIPRPETEFWVEKAINTIKSAQGSPRQGLGEPWADIRVLDLCAGSGAIGVALAKAIPEAPVTFAELDPNHLPTIKINITGNGIDASRCEMIASDLFQAVTGTFDFILTNPPYIDAAAKTVDESVTAHEPHLALFGGLAGMEIIARIVEGARAKLALPGQLWIEHEPFQSDAIAILADAHGFSATTYPDQYGTHRYSVLTPVVPK
jgi:release factor glutamine methyltransferase